MNYAGPSLENLNANYTLKELDSHCVLFVFRTNMYSQISIYNKRKTKKVLHFPMHFKIF